MKNTFSINSVKLFAGLKLLTLFALIIFLLNSCKKEFLTAETEDNIIKSQTGAASINTIGYNEFLKKVNLNKIGKVGEVFRDNPSSASVRIENSNTSGLALEIETTNIKELKTKGHISYVFPIKLSSKYAQSFSNLTIDIKGDTVRAFINTYKPTIEWIKNWKLKRAGAFTGQVDYAYVDVNSEGKQETRALMNVQDHCIDWQEYYLIPNQCQGPPYHWPGDDSCSLFDELGGAYYTIGTLTRTLCTFGGGGGEGTGGNQGGGGGITIPNTPYGYEPCDQPPSRPNPDVPPCENPTMAENLISILGIIEQSQIDFLNNPTPARVLLVKQMNTYLWANQGSLESQKFLIWSIGYLTENTNMSLEALRYNLTNKPFYFDVSQEVYTPKDREPTSYYWRPKLTNSENFSEHVNFVPITTPSIDIVNCHYYAFGDVPGAAKLQGSPKHILSMDITPQWQKVTGNIQVGDRIAYYTAQPSDTVARWTHSGIVIEVDSEGYATKISSKMGPYYVVIEHHPRDIPPSYGSNEASFLLNGSPLPSRIYWRKK